MKNITIIASVATIGFVCGGIVLSKMIHNIHMQNSARQVAINEDIPTDGPSEEEILSAIKSIEELTIEIFEVQYYESQQQLILAIAVSIPLPKHYLVSKLEHSIQIAIDGKVVYNNGGDLVAGMKFIPNNSSGYSNILRINHKSCPKEGAVITAVWKHLNLKNSTSETKKAKNHIFSRTNSFRP